MKLPRLLPIAGIVLIALTGSTVILIRGWNWYQGLVLPRSVKPEMGTTIWVSPAGAVGTAREGPAEPPMPRAQAARLLQNPEPATPASVERGKNAYSTYCAVCHGSGGHGDGPSAKKLILPLPNLPATLGTRSDGYLYATIRNGGVLMPPQGYRIPPGERWDLVNYLRSIALPVQNISQATVPLVAASPPSTTGGERTEEGKGEKEEVSIGDAARGKEVFEAQCQICHEANSEEMLVGPGLKGLFKRHKLPDGAEHEHAEAAIREQIVNGGGAMPPMGSALSDEQLDDLIAYLQTL